MGACPNTFEKGCLGRRVEPRRTLRAVDEGNAGEGNRESVLAGRAMAIAISGSLIQGLMGESVATNIPRMGRSPTAQFSP